MLKACSETKVLRDVIHGYIHIELQVIWDLLNTQEFQRLRRIHQLGGVFQVYHNAEHTRFSHSLGVYEIVRRMVYEIKDIRDRLNEYEKATVMIAGLLHDIGHLPFSHGFERVCAIPHEEFSKQIILGDSEIHKILAKADEKLPKDVADIIAYKHRNNLLNQIVSGQLDADRMDYLLRDAYFSGTSYGNFDLERILRTIRVKDGRIVVKESGMHSVEDYIMARYHMYWQVYYHPNVRSYEIIIEKIFQRLRDIYPENEEMFADLKMFIPFLSNNPTIKDHLRLDESAAFYGFTLLCQKEDKILKDLCSRVLNRRLFDYKSIKKEEEIEIIKEEVGKKGFDSTYYVRIDKASKSPYLPYKSNDTHNIYVLEEEGTVCELSQKSVIVKSIVQGDVKEDKKVYFPK